MNKKLIERLDSTEQSFRDAKNHVYGLAHNVCLNGKEQKVLLAYMGDIEIHSLKCGESGQRIIQLLISCIYDGLAFGNWPWIINSVNTLEKENKAEIEI